MYKDTKNQWDTQIFKELFRYMNVKYQSVILTINRDVSSLFLRTENWTPYHFADISKMVGYLLPCIGTWCFCFFDNSFEITPLAITQHMCKFSCTPTFYAFVIVGNSFEMLEQFFDFFFFHNCLFLWYFGKVTLFIWL